jgi:hypothetical protein
MSGTTRNTGFLDCSGSPLILLPMRLASRWRGITDTASEKPLDLNLDDPHTDYDRACAASRSANALFNFGGQEVLVIYTECDWHTWVEEMSVVMCGHWIPKPELLESVSWIDPLVWNCSEANPILLNSSVDAADGLTESEHFLKMTLRSGVYKVETALVTDGTFGGIAHRFRLQ